MTTIADYVVVETLGEGNHGTFHLAQPPARLGLGDAQVAVKVLARGATDADFDRFARELQIFASVESPHLVELFEAGQQDGRLFYAMRHYPKGSIEDAALEPADAIRAMVSAARGAHDLHEVGVVHRDIKPRNVLLTDSGAVLSDLGLALVWTPGAETTGVGPIGSIHYMEPDVIYGERATRATDIWSLAITANEAITGQRCYEDLPSDSALEVFRHVLHTRPTLSAGLSAPVRAVLERALAPDREDRHDTAAQFADELAAAGGVS